MRDLTSVVEHKAELVALIALKNQAMQQLNSMQTKLRQLEIMLGEPQVCHVKCYDSCTFFSLESTFLNVQLPRWGWGL